METAKLKKIAQFARRSLIEQVFGKLQLVLAQESAARRENAEAVRQLEGQIAESDEAQVVEKVAYIWFNRFCALRFMDVNRYTRIGVVSAAEGQFQPEILAEAKMGHIDEGMVPEKTRQQIFTLLNGTTPSRDPQAEAYRLLVVAACNDFHKAMPYLFEKITDYTELLMPDDLLSGNSILAYTREAMTPDACQDVEVIGWLYQFYISEKKDQVFEGLKKNQKITPENIPAATQLFTPHWIVRYLVENSLGRLWMLNRPNSRLIEQMAYYIKPEQAETDFLRIGKPEELKICDPASGSGHMLVYAFDLLYTIYEEEGYEPAEIPEKILTHNLYGIEIDERAGELAAFALTMKARSKNRRFFSKQVAPNICVLRNIHFENLELKAYMDAVGRDLFTINLQETLRQFEEADNFGSLIRPAVTDVASMVKRLDAKNVSGYLFLNQTHNKVLQVLKQADYLSPKYHVVVANPPYMGSAGMNVNLKTWLQIAFPQSKSDLMTCFMERSRAFVRSSGYWAMINLPSWMFLGTYQEMRETLVSEQSIVSLLQLGRGIFGPDFGTVAFVMENRSPRPNETAVYRRLFEKHVSVRQPSEIEALYFDKSYNCFTVEQSKLQSIPGSPIAFWISDTLRNHFRSELLGSIGTCRNGMTTGENDRFMRNWHEVSQKMTCFTAANQAEAVESGVTWFPYSKGGMFRKWFGNNDFLINWKNNGEVLKNNKPKTILRNPAYYFREAITWSLTSSLAFGARFRDAGAFFDVNGMSSFFEEQNVNVIALLNSKVCAGILRVINPTIAFQSGDIERIPFLRKSFTAECKSNTETILRLARTDWNSYETSWDFTCLPLLHPDYRQPTLKTTYQKLRAYWREITLEMQCLEEDNNGIFIDVYGLQDELTPEVPLSEITLTCNPQYRYGGYKSDDELEVLLQADTIKEFISYGVGCMFGRYALDKPGLVLANQGETIDDYLKQIPKPTFPADDDNVIPMLDGDWFTDDISERFRKFLRVTFGEEHYEANLTFIEKALGKDIRKYFLRDFYSDHVRRYKKRPIYWLFSSPKGSFNALIYLHRYRPDTVSVVLNDYLREFRTKLTSHKNHLEAVSISASASQGEKTKALKEIEKITKMIAEMEEYEREVLYPLATEQVEIDLDDGVKVNYPKLGAALKNIVGLDAKEEA